MSTLQSHRLEPIRIGFPYEVAISFPASYLAVGETLRASLRKTPSDSASLVDFTAARVDDIVTLSLTKTQTAALTPAQAIMDLVIVSGAVQYAISSPRFLLAVEHHATRHG